VHLEVRDSGDWLRVRSCAKQNDRRLEVAVTGYEGMTGTALLAGSDRFPHKVFIQGSDAAHRIWRRSSD
jgi:hypothetical protein